MNRKQKAKLIGDCFKQRIRDAQAIFGMSDAWGEWTVAHVEKHSKGICRNEERPRSLKKVLSVSEWKRTVGNRKTNEGEDLGSVEVSCDSHQGFFDVVGRSVAYVRQNLRHVYNIAPDALPIVTVQGVRHALENAAREEEFILTPNSRLDFLYDEGVKGAGPFLTHDELRSILTLDQKQFEELLARGLQKLELVLNGERLFSDDEVTQWLQCGGWRKEEKPIAISPSASTSPTSTSAALTAATVADSSWVWADRDRFTVGIGVRECRLGNTKEFAIFERLSKLLNERPDNYIHWETLSKDVWDEIVEKNTLQKTISQLRKELRNAKLYAPDVPMPSPSAAALCFLMIDGTQKDHYRMVYSPPA